MASSMAEDLVCSVCLSIFQEPHMLRCGHNFCLSCLESCIPRGRKKGKCPECRHSFSRQEFTCNRALANLAKKARQIQLDQESLSAAALVGLCEEHDEPLTLFCQQDLLPICVICQDMPQHWGHEFLPVRDAVKDTKGKPKPHRTRPGNSLREVSKDLIDQQKEMAKLEGSVQGQMDFFLGSIQVVENAHRDGIYTHGPRRSFHWSLQKEEQDLKKTVEERKAENLQRKEDALQPLNEEVSSHTKMNTQIKTALEIANNFSFFKVLKELMYRVKEFLVWLVKADYASMREMEGCDEEEAKSNEAHHEDEDYSEDGEESEEDDDSGDWDISEEEEEDDSGDWDITEEEEEDSGDWDITEEEEEYSGDWDISEGDGEVSEEEMDGDGEVSKEEDGDGEVSEEEEDGEGEISKEEEGDGEVSEEEEDGFGEVSKEEVGEGEISKEEDGDGEVSEKEEEEECQHL
ncbi:hypothetical protein lerEdw1_011423 [Lerista edwardsae]|nr:hypothetical protein lerEdw1_011423 [Lerista edwardsae]